LGKSQLSNPALSAARSGAGPARQQVEPGRVTPGQATASPAPSRGAGSHRSFDPHANLTQTGSPSAPADGGQLVSLPDRQPADSEKCRRSVVLADDHPSVRNGLKRLLAQQEDFAVVGETGDGLEALALVTLFRPTLLICDLSMPGLHGLELTRTVRAVCPATRVVILSVHADEPYPVRALELGASGYVLKSASSGHLLAAIRAAARGERYLSPPFPASLLG
jgi:CheY-like chemotaxis protein